MATGGTNFLGLTGTNIYEFTAIFNFCLSGLSF